MTSRAPTQQCWLHATRHTWHFCLYQGRYSVERRWRYEVCVELIGINCSLSHHHGVAIVTVHPVCCMNTDLAADHHSYGCESTFGYCCWCRTLTEAVKLMSSPCLILWTASLGWQVNYYLFTAKTQQTVYNILLWNLGLHQVDKHRLTIAVVIND